MPCFHCHRYSPTILLLRHFDVFKNLGSQDGSLGDRVGVSFEIASVIRELTEPVSNGDSSMEEKSNSNFVRFSFLSLVLHCALHSFT
jgi:peroxin-6